MALSDVYRSSPTSTYPTQPIALIFYSVSPLYLAGLYVPDDPGGKYGGIVQDQALLEVDIDVSVQLGL